jgi:ADP-heptose:LPS heptosyltransferase
VINTSMTWPSRSWPIENWQRLADSLIHRNLTVAVVGKDVSSKADKLDKRSTPLAGCRDLVNKLSLDQTNFTIGKCGVFVSCQNGLSVLSGATDTELVILDMAIEWSKRAIYRHESPLYKVTYVKGGCSAYCAMAFQCPHPIRCETFKCRPSYDAVAAAVEDKLSSRGAKIAAA